MARHPLRVALTGGIASGKSYCLRRFAELGAPVIDADTLAHAAIEPRTPGFDAVLHHFGSAILAPSGAIDRVALGRIVFADAHRRRELEAIVHPVVYHAIRDWFDASPTPAPTSDDFFRIADIPLLYETHGETGVDRVIVATCDAETQMARLIARGLSEADGRGRILAQTPLDEKARRADYVIDTSGSTGETDRQVVEISERLRAESRARSTT